MGKHAINPQFAQNHWVRNNSQLLSNYSGFGLEFYYACSQNSNVALRHYAISTAEKGDMGEEKDSSLMMLDYTVSFM